MDDCTPGTANGKRYLGHDGEWYDAPCNATEGGGKLIIGLSGRKCSGKDTAAGQIRDILGDWVLRNADCSSRGMHNTQFEFLHFADPLKRELIARGWITREQAYGTDEQKSTPSKVTWHSLENIGIFWEVDPDIRPCGYLSSRQLMQFWGTMMRDIDPDVWVNITMRAALSCPEPLCIIADVRFPNEVKAIQDAGGKVIRLLRNPHPDDMDETETALDNARVVYDTIVPHNLTIDEQSEALRERVTPWFQLHFGQTASDANSEKSNDGKDTP